MVIRILDESVIHQIAAGEVVERPSSVVKELIENSLDAQSTNVTITMRQAGQTYLSVDDNGIGMNSDDLSRCILRHATSKIPDHDLFNIQTFGFRGEALPAIAAVSHLTITTRQINNAVGNQLSVIHGRPSDVQPAARAYGTHVEVTHLFSNTPTRLKFLRSMGVERSKIYDVVRAYILSHRHVMFKLYDDKRLILTSPSQLSEKNDNVMLMHCGDTVFGTSFSQNAHIFHDNLDDWRIDGIVSIPIYHRSHALDQFFFVNQRFVFDRTLRHLFKASYQELMPKGRHPVGALFIQMPYDLVDVNVHPAKTEVRFRDMDTVRRLVMGSLRNAIHQCHLPQALDEISQRANQYENSDPTSGTPMFLRQHHEHHAPLHPLQHITLPPQFPSSHHQQFKLNLAPPSSKNKPCHANEDALYLGDKHTSSSSSHHQSLHEDVLETNHVKPLCLGRPLAQIHNMYIVAQHDDGLIIIDQHAAHERITFEKMKQDYATQTLKEPCPLIVPIIVSIDSFDLAYLSPYLQHLKTLGLECTIQEKDAQQSELLIQTMPTYLRITDCQQFIQEILAQLRKFESTDPQEILDALMIALTANHACHNSIRSGQKMTFDEMDALLRLMEKTPHADQCNHGRPTFIHFTLAQLNRMFQRS